MRLHENNLLFQQAVPITADRMQSAALYVEKNLACAACVAGCSAMPAPNSV